ncbi:MAG TPA: hypothetical protein VFK02_16755 [Kofleriaceae bacterium]|nr:hypothetical protein [Kofleriaceae bacterium]
MRVSSSGSDLGRVAAVSDQIRRIARQAFLMQLHAINAIVMTRSHGVRVPGFEVVSEQMRQLSRELGDCLGQLRTATVQWLRTVSHQVADERSIAILEHASAASPASARVIAPVLARLGADDATAAANRATRRAFVQLLDDARQLAATGCVLARTAKLEATYGDTLAVSLAEAAASFTELADSVDESVRTIARRLSDGRWSLA